LLLTAADLDERRQILDKERWLFEAGHGDATKSASETESTGAISRNGGVNVYRLPLTVRR
jgi:hypothetical protein